MQSFLILESYKNARRLRPINDASTRTNETVELHFVTDEISLPVGSGKIVCEVLAVRRDGNRSTPVLLELKDGRMLTRLVEQVESYAAPIDEHADLFAELFSALLGETVRFDGSTEKWIVWPAAGIGRDPREEELRRRVIRVVSYTQPSAGSTRCGSGTADVSDMRFAQLGRRPSLLVVLINLRPHPPRSRPGLQAERAAR